MYKIIRRYFNGGSQGNANGSYYSPRTIARGLTLAEAQVHCSDLETSSSTCQKASNKRHTAQRGAWFDSYTAE